MKANRKALLGLLVCLASAVASAQIAPNNQGDIGLFTMPTADTPLAGQLTLGLYGWKEQLVAGNLAFTDTPDRRRLYSHWAGEVSLGFGLTRAWTVYVSGGEERFESRGGWTGGAINSTSFFSGFKADEPRKVRFGTKLRLLSEADSEVRIGLFLSAQVPVGHATIHVDESLDQADINRVKSRRTDWEWGAVLTKGIFTGVVSYQLSGKHDQDIRVANNLRVALGVDVPLLPHLHVIGELDRTLPDGGDLPPDSYSMLINGVRFYLGRTGLAFSAALSANLDQLLRHGFSPSPIGGLVGVTYAAWPPLPPPPVVIPPPAPAVVIEEKTEIVQPAPSPAPPLPAPRTTRDEIYFDAGSARLTNIAKAVLDGIALRMKNDLNSTAAIAGYSDNAGSEEANLAISAKRAEAAKEYLVTRHGIDPNRIVTVAKGSAEPAFDNASAEGRAKNRRAVIVVTLVSGS